MIYNKRILITGGAGFIGSSLARKYVEKNKVVVLDNLFRDSLTGTKLAKHKNLIFINGDVTDYKTVEEASKGCEYIIHCAAIAGIDTVVKDPVRTIMVDFLGAQNVLGAANKNKNIEKVVIFSTGEIFGDSAKIKEDSLAQIKTTGEPRWGYAASKLCSEYLAKAYYTKYHLPIVIIRPFNVYGPFQTGDSAVLSFIKAVVNKENLIVRGGSQVRSWCYIDDFVEQVAIVLESKNIHTIGEYFNIGNSKEIMTIYNLAKTVIRTLKSDSKIEFFPLIGADIEFRIPSMIKSRNFIKYEPKIDIEEGILKTAEALGNNE